MSGSGPVERRNEDGLTAQDETIAFGELAPFLRVRPELQQICRFGAQWASDHGPEQAGWAPFHIVTAGACLLDAGDLRAIRLGTGDVAILPHGGPHLVRALPTAGGSAAPMRIVRRRSDDILVKSNVDRDPDTMLICGRLRFEQAHDNMVLAALPHVVVLHAANGRDAGRLRMIVEVTRDELDDDRPGAAFVAATLASSIMTLVLRAHLESQHAGQGLLGLLAGRQTARAVGSMLREPARPWTLDELAGQAKTSRATLVRLFRKAADTSPLAFLGELRLTLARHRIRATHLPVAVIAEDVGYQSETAFSRAYQRRFSVAPGADRRSGSSTAVGTP